MRQTAHHVVMGVAAVVAAIVAQEPATIADTLPRLVADTVASVGASDSVVLRATVESGRPTAEPSPLVPHTAMPVPQEQTAVERVASATAPVLSEAQAGGIEDRGAVQGMASTGPRVDRAWVKDYLRLQRSPGACALQSALIPGLGLATQGKVGRGLAYLLAIGGTTVGSVLFKIGYDKEYRRYLDGNEYSSAADVEAYAIMYQACGIAACVLYALNVGDAMIQAQAYNKGVQVALRKSF